MASKSTSRTLTDHHEIRRWAEEREARPAVVRSTHQTESSGIIRLDFRGYSGEESLEEIEWNEWFEDFDRNKLALVVQDQTANGEQSNFNKLVSREDVDDYSTDSGDKTMRTQKRRPTKSSAKSSKSSRASKATSSARKAEGSSSSNQGKRSKSGHRQPQSKRKAA
jgi:hypothetical protein